MGTRLADVLNECLEQLSQGATLEECLKKYPRFSRELEPLLAMAQSATQIPKVTPSEEFVEASKARLLARIRQETTTAKTTKAKKVGVSFGAFARFWRRGLANIFNPKHLAIPATAMLIVVLVAGLLGVFNFSSPSPALALQCTLSILSGNVIVFDSQIAAYRPGNDGMTLTAGTRIRTSPDSHALLTFFEGSTITLEPDTEIEVREVQQADELATSIVLKQWAGKTWSRVVRLADPASRYEIETPTATAAVRGTLFKTEVAESGATRVATTEGLVNVQAQGEEVSVPANRQTRVEAETAPSVPDNIPRLESALLITIDGPAVGSVRAPSGASTGSLPNQISFNQIAGSQSWTTTGTQMINIPEPVAGEYLIALRYTADSSAGFSIGTLIAGETRKVYGGEWPGTVGSGWLLHLNLRVDDGYIAGIGLDKWEPLGGKAIEKIVLTAPPKGRSMVVTLPEGGKRGEQVLQKIIEGKTNKDTGVGQGQAKLDENTVIAPETSAAQGKENGSATDSSAASAGKGKSEKSDTSATSATGQSGAGAGNTNATPTDSVNTSADQNKGTNNKGPNKGQGNDKPSAGTGQGDDNPSGNTGQGNNNGQGQANDKDQGTVDPGQYNGVEQNKDPDNGKAPGDEGKLNDNDDTGKKKYPEPPRPTMP